jgi:hypothetical protein
MWVNMQLSYYILLFIHHIRLSRVGVFPKYEFETHLKIMCGNKKFKPHYSVLNVMFFPDIVHSTHLLFVKISSLLQYTIYISLLCDYRNEGSPSYILLVLWFLSDK